MSAEIPQDLVLLFIEETRGILEKVSDDLQQLVESPANRALMREVLRGLHTTAGSAGFLGFARLQGLSRAAERVLDRGRKGELDFTPTVFARVFEAVARIDELFSGIASRQAEPETDVQPTIDTLTVLAERGDVEPASVPPVPASRPEPSPSPSPAPPAARRPLGEILVETGVPRGAVRDALAAQDLKVGEILLARNAATKEQLAAALERQRESGDGASAEPEVRVGVARLDRLMNLVGELVLCRNRLTQTWKEVMNELSEMQGWTTGEAVAEAISSLDLLTGDLQAAVMKARMQPIGRVFGRFQDLAGDAARAFGKKVVLSLAGAETEVDKAVIEVLRSSLQDWLFYVIRRGIEPPGARIAQSKREEGTIRLETSHEGNSLILSMKDDGSGIDPQDLARIAVARRWITAEECDRLGESDKLALVFHPEFDPWNPELRKLGLGDPLSAIPEKVARLNGSITLRGARGAGTELTIRLPLSYAILQTLGIQIGREIYAVPLVSVVEIVKIDPGRIRRIEGREVLNFRDQVIPIVDLARLFRVRKSKAGSTAADRYLVIVSVAAKTLGILVDRPLGQEEVVVKTLQGVIRNTKGIAGAAIRGDGQVILILNLADLLSVG